MSEFVAEDGALDESSIYKSKYGEIRTAFKNIPADEPVFLLRGQDLLAPRAIIAYAEELRNEGERRDDPRFYEMASNVDMVASYMLVWQQMHADRTKLPD